MWKQEFEPKGPQGPDDWDRQDATLGRLFAVALAAAAALAVASTMPGPLVAPAMRELLFFAAWGALLVALLRRDQPFAHEVTAWDQAAILLLLSLLWGFFVDPEAVAQALNEIAPEAETAPA